MTGAPSYPGTLPRSTQQIHNLSYEEALLSYPETEPVRRVERPIFDDRLTRNSHWSDEHVVSSSC